MLFKRSASCRRLLVVIIINSVLFSLSSHELSNWIEDDFKIGVYMYLFLGHDFLTEVVQSSHNKRNNYFLS